MRITAVKETVREYDFSMPGAADVKAMLPPPVRTISFELHNANPAVANAIRRTAISEVKTKALYYDALSVETNEEYIVPDNLHDRIALIPLDQDCPEDATFSLDVANISEARTIDVLAADIEGRKNYFNPQFRLATLHQGKYLRIPKIHVKTGYGYEHSRWSLTRDISYTNLDYVDVAFLTPHGSIDKRKVKKEDLDKMLQKRKIKIPEGKEVLIVESAKRTHEPNLHPRYVPVEETLQSHLSTNATPSNFALSFTFCNIAPRKGMLKIFDSIIERLNAILEYDKPESTIVRFIRKDNLVHFYISNETHTIANLIVQKIMDLDPGVGLVNACLEHPLNRAITINLRHAQPDKILKDAISKCVADFKSLRAAFV